MSRFNNKDGSLFKVRVDFPHPVIINNSFEQKKLTKEVIELLTENVLFYGYNMHELQYVYYYENTIFPYIVYRIETQEYHGKMDA